MGDFPPEWTWIRDLDEGGQAHTFVVKRADRQNDREYVLKRLENPKREEYFEREIHACKNLNHPNVLRLIESGKTPKGRPFLITEYCADGPLKYPLKVTGLAPSLRLFERIVSGLAYAHSQTPSICHLDLKPENIFMKDDQPVVGDWGICFAEDQEVTIESSPEAAC